MTKTAIRIASVLGLIWALPFVAWPPLLIPYFVAQQAAQFTDDSGRVLFNLGMMALLGGMHFAMRVWAVRELVHPRIADWTEGADASPGSSILPRDRLDDRIRGT